MSDQYALVENGTVVNIILWDGIADYSPPDGQTVVQIPDGVSANIGYAYDGSAFIAPPAPPPPVLTPDQIRTINAAQQSALNAVATNKIAIYTDATDPDIVDTVDPADTASLKAWKQYRVALNKVDLTQESPAWPSPPPN